MGCLLDAQPFQIVKFESYFGNFQEGSSPYPCFPPKSFHEIFTLPCRERQVDELKCKTRAGRQKMIFLLTTVN